MATDGSIVIETDIDNKEAQKELNKSSRTIIFVSAYRQQTNSVFGKSVKFQKDEKNPVGRKF